MSSAMGDPSLARGFYNCPETPSPVSLLVIGQLPAWLNGVLYRTGPGTYSIPIRKGGDTEGDQSTDETFEIRHWFDGLTLHHRFEIQNGQVSYRSKKGATAVEEYITRTGVFPPGGNFGQANPCESLLGKLFTKFTQSAPEKAPRGPVGFNVSVTLTPEYPGFKGHLVSKTDANILQVLDRVTLEPLAIKSYRSVLPQLDGPLAAAHAGVEDGEYYNYTLSLGRNPVYNVFKIDSQGKGTILAEIAAPAAYIHTVFLTKRYLVLAIWQCDFKLAGFPMMVHGSMSVNTFKPWSNSRKTLFFVVDRQKGGVVARYQSKTFFAFHCINSYDDDDGSIVLDIACYEDNTILELNTLENLRNLSLKPSKPYSLAVTARRFRLPSPTPNTTSGTFLDAKLEFDLGLPANIELPVVSPNVANRPYRYAYGIHTQRDSEQSLSTALANSIIKLDMHTGKTYVWRDRSGNHVPGEPIFVPQPTEGDMELAEDAGVLLTVALNAQKGFSALVVINAQTMEEVARAEMSIPFPFAFHGAFSKL